MLTFKQENMFRAVGKEKSLETISRLADSYEHISLSDTVEKQVRTNSHWALMPNHGLHSSVIPAKITAGFIGFPQFPEFIGKLSTRRKVVREVKELKTAFQGTNRLMMVSHVAPLVVTQISNLLKQKQKQGISQVISILKAHNLNMTLFKENLFNLVSEKRQDKFKNVPTGVKSAFTKAYNGVFKSSLVKKKAKDKGDKPFVVDEDGNELSEYSEEELIDLTEVKLETKKGKKTKK